MKLKTFSQRDESYIKQKEQLEAYIHGKKEHSDIKFEQYKPISMSFDFMTVDELLDYNIPVFQRKIQQGRLRNIADKMYPYGFDYSNPLTITLPGRQLTDGGHRFIDLSVIYKDDPTKQFPVIIMEFKSLAEEAAYFKIMQSADGGAVVAADRLKSSFFANEPYGICIYNIGLIDNQSLFSTKVAFRKDIPKKYVPEAILSVFQSTTCPFNVGAFTRMFHWIGLRYRRNWEQRKEEYLNKMVESVDYTVIRDRMNHFADWMFSWTSSTPPKEICRNPVLVGFMDFYLTVLYQPKLSAKKQALILKIASNKFVTWDWYRSKLMSCKPDEALEIVLKEYNTGRTSNRIQPLDNYEVFGVKLLK